MHLRVLKDLEKRTAAPPTLLATPLVQGRQRAGDATAQSTQGVQNALALPPSLLTDTKEKQK